MLPNGLDILGCYLACFQTGAIAAPLNYRYASAELEQALTVAEPRLLIVHQSRLPVLSGVAPAVAGASHVIVAGASGDLPSGMTAFEDLLFETPGEAAHAPAPDSPAVMFFTSGSTGRPKGVVHTQRSALAILQSTTAAFGGVREDDVIQVAEPQVHASGFIASLSVLMHGGTVVLLEGYQEEQYVAQMRQWRPTLICTHIDTLSKLLHWPGIERADFASLRGVFTGGDSVPPALQQHFIDIAGLPIQIGWGMTEAIWLTICREPRFEDAECIGTPIDGVEIRATDPSGQDVADGASGELRVRGPMVMQGYWNDPDETARALEYGWLRTGDSGWRDADGTWWFAGRLKELIVRNTSKITPGEVEAALDAHEAVLTSGVVAMPDTVEGEVPVAFVALKPGQAVDEAALLTFLASRIARYKIPVRIRFLETLPLTRSGKLDHLALKARVTEVD